MSLSIDAGTVKEYAVLFGALLSAIVFGTYWVPKADRLAAADAET